MLAMLQSMSQAERDALLQQVEAGAAGGSGGGGPSPAVSAGPAFARPALTEDVPVMPGAAEFNAAVYAKAIITAAELLENALGAGATSFQLRVTDVGTKKARAQASRQRQR